jgi:hypothetical protein
MFLISLKAFRRPGRPAADRRDAPRHSRLLLLGNMGFKTSMTGSS